LVGVSSPELGTKERLSGDLEFIRNGNRGLLYDRLRGGGLVLEGFGCDLVLALLARQYSSGEEPVVVAEGPGWSDLLPLLRQHGFLRPWAAGPPIDPRTNEQMIRNGAFVQQLSLMMSMTCNYACRDCFVFNEEANLLPPAHRRLRWETAEQALTKFFAVRGAIPESPLVVRLFGGEPLLNWPVVRDVVNWVRSRDQLCPIYLTTNGSRLTQARLGFLDAHGVTTFISLNGVKDVNDKIRVDHTGRGTFDRTLEGLAPVLRQARETHVGVTLDSDESILRLGDLIDLLKSLRLDPNRPIILYLSLLKGKVDATKFRLNDSELAEHIVHHWRTGLNDAVYLGGKLFLCLRNAFRSPVRFDRWCQRGGGIVVYPDGEVRPCSGTSHSLGRLDDFPGLLSSDAHLAVSRRLGGQISGCGGCAVEGLCGGSCACSSRAGLYEYEPGINCDFERTLFRSLARAFLELPAHMLDQSGGPPRTGSEEL
jgi:uncharacterized protein